MTAQVLQELISLEGSLGGALRRIEVFPSNLSFHLFHSSMLLVRAIPSFYAEAHSINVSNASLRLAASNKCIHSQAHTPQIPGHPSLSKNAQAGLADLLSDPTAGPFTVFAPVNSALESVPGGLMPVVAEKKSLTNLVRFHVALGALTMTSTMSAATSEPMVRITAESEAVPAAAVPTGAEVSGGRLFTPTLANATAEERSALSGERFASGPRLWTLLYDQYADGIEGGRSTAGTITIQIAAPASEDGGGVNVGSSDSAVCGGVRVFLGPGGGRERNGGADLFLGAFAAEVVLPDMGAVNGVVHGISGIMTYPGYKRPAPPSSVK